MGTMSEAVGTRVSPYDKCPPSAAAPSTLSPSKHASVEDRLQPEPESDVAADVKTNVSRALALICLLPHMSRLYSQRHTCFRMSSCFVLTIKIFKMCRFKLVLNFAGLRIREITAVERTKALASRDVFTGFVLI